MLVFLILQAIASSRANDIILVSPDNVIKTLPNLGPEFKITFELLFNCFDEPKDPATAVYDIFDILTFTQADGKVLSLDFLFKDKVLQLHFNGIPTKTSPSGVFTTKVWYQYLIVQEKKGDKFSFSLSVNGRQLFEALQTDPKTYDDVEVFAGKGFNVANALLKNFKVLTKTCMFQDCIEQRTVKGEKYILLDSSSTTDGSNCADGCLYYKEEDGPSGSKYCFGPILTSLKGTYKKVFSHDSKSGLFSRASDALRINPDHPGASKFSILDQLEDFRSSDGKFRLKVCYPEVTTGVGGKKCNEWIQTSNPATESTIMGYEPVDIAFAKNSYSEQWKGLGKNVDSYTVALIDDAPGRSSWWMAIGATRNFPSGGNQIPGPVGVSVTKVELYVKQT